MAKATIDAVMESNVGVKNLLGKLKYHSTQGYGILIFSHNLIYSNKMKIMSAISSVTLYIYIYTHVVYKEV